MTYNEALKTTEEYGIIQEVFHPIIKVSGLPGARIDEIVITETGETGKVVALNKDHVEVVVFSKSPVVPKTKVARTNTHLSVPVGKEYLGRVIDPLGNLIFEDTNFTNPSETREIDLSPVKMNYRQRITKQFGTGITMIDQLLPLGKGQRELIVGDRKTGKTSIFLTIMNKQINEGQIIIYAVIGKKSIEIKSLKEYIESIGIQDNVLIVATSAEDSPSLIDLTPYTAMTFAEHYRDTLKKDVLVILDDLTTHAKFYREFSLISKKFPGRDSYPGDIFYKHAKLLERAGNFKNGDSENSITCLPVAETTQGNLTDYIVSNLISITDGHLLFDVDIFNKGVRPAINIFLSVTRVGRQTQDALSREISSELMAFLIKYEKALRFSHFGAEMSQALKDVLARGEQIYSFFQQKFDVIMPMQIQHFFVLLIMQDFLYGFEAKKINEVRNTLIQKYKDDTQLKELVTKVLSGNSLSVVKENIESNKNEIKQILKIELESETKKNEGSK